MNALLPLCPGSGPGLGPLPWVYQSARSQLLLLLLRHPGPWGEDTGPHAHPGTRPSQTLGQRDSLQNE